MPNDNAALPRYFKDGAGYCYIATPALASAPGMTPWDGDVDARGFAQEGEYVPPVIAAAFVPEPPSLDAELAALTVLDSPLPLVEHKPKRIRSRGKQA